MTKNKLDKEGKNFIKTNEGLRLESYLCDGKVWTIGYGSTRIPFKRGELYIPVTQGMSCTYTYANELFEDTVTLYEDIVNKWIEVDLTQNQFNALVDFAYNFGESNFSNSTLRRKINSGASKEEISHEFRRWVYADGEENEGLVSRREMEIDLYFS